MIIFFIYFISIFVVTIGFGLLVKNFLVKEGLINTLGLGDTGLLGFYFILLLSFLLHFFIPLNYYVTVLIFISGAILFFYFKNIAEIFSPYKFLILIILLLPGLFSIKGHPDLEWYHLPYMNYLRDFKIIFGIANVSDYFAYQSWNDIAGALRLPIIEVKGINIIPIVFALYFLISLIEILVKTNNVALKIFIYLILIFSISKYHKINEYGGHVPPQLLGFLINIYFYMLILESNNKFKEIISKILIFSSFIFLLRINYVFIFPIILFILIKYRYVVFDFLLNKKILILIILIPCIYFTKNIIHTGCLMYPVDYTCFTKEKIVWSIGNDYANLRSAGVLAGIKGWNEYSAIEGGIDNSGDSLKNNQILSRKNYLNQGKFFWTKYWVQSGDTIKILNNIIIIFFCMFFIFFVGKFQNHSTNKKNIFYNFFIPCTVFLFQVILWFILTPQTLYGGDVATVIFCAFLSSFFLKNLILDNFRTKIAIISLFVLSISYFEIRNIQRTYDEYFQNNNKLKFFPWIEIKKNKLGTDYYQMLIDGYTLNIQKKVKGSKIGSPDPCGNTPMICVSQYRTQCIKGIDKRFGYLLIEGNELQCINLLKEKPWY